MLLALPLALLPVLIHLINQRRYQNVPWAAMMFLRAATRMSRGWARIRQWLILAVRVGALVALVIAVARPLAGGWLGGVGGGRADTTILVVDRSASMGARSVGSGATKLERGLAQLAGALEAVGSGRWVLIESGTGRPRELESPAALRGLAALGVTAGTADLPGMLEAARSYLVENRVGRAEIWILSDLRAADWDGEGGRWPALRDGFLSFPQSVRFHVLADPETEPGNVGVRVSGVRLREGGEGVELLVTVVLTRDEREAGPRMVPVRFELDGVRSELSVEMSGSRQELRDHRIVLGQGAKRGWGRVSIPSDGEPSDDEFYFVYDEPAVRRTAVVAEDPRAVEAIELAAGIAPEGGLRCEVERVGREQVGALDWESLGLLVWQGELPEGEDAERIRGYLGRGGVALFLPPRGGGGPEFMGFKWGAWRAEAEGWAVESWRSDHDLLARTSGGAPLPVGTLRVRRVCEVEGELTPLAMLAGGVPLLGRVSTEGGGAYVLGTTVAAGDSSLAVDGVVLYVMVHRALAAGAAVLGRTRMVDAGAESMEGSGWVRLAGREGSVSSEYPIQAGVYEQAERLWAVNRRAVEDEPAILDGEQLGGLFRGLRWIRVDAGGEDRPALIEEIWRAFLVAMLVLLVGEAALCLPKRAVGVGRGELVS
jgi:hypothetical protein